MSGCFLCVYVGVPHAGLVLKEAGRGHQSSQNWSYIVSQCECCELSLFFWKISQGLVTEHLSSLYLLQYSSSFSTQFPSVPQYCLGLAAG